MSYDEGQASPYEERKLIDEIRGLIQKKGLPVDLVETREVDSQLAREYATFRDSCTRCNFCPCIICP